MINELRKINQKLIQEYQDDLSKLKTQLIIEKILEKDDCFFHIDIETAYSILKDLHISEENIKDVYKHLIDIRKGN